MSPPLYYQPTNVLDDEGKQWASHPDEHVGQADPDMCQSLLKHLWHRPKYELPQLKKERAELPSSAQEILPGNGKQAKSANGKSKRNGNHARQLCSG